MLPGVRNWELVIVVAFVVSFRSIEEALGGSVTAATAIVRFVLGGLVSWAAIALLERIWTSYSNAARQRQMAEYMRQRSERARAQMQQSSFPHPTTRGGSHVTFCVPSGGPYGHVARPTTRP